MPSRSGLRLTLPTFKKFGSGETEEFAQNPSTSRSYTWPGAQGCQEHDSLTVMPLAGTSSVLFKAYLVVHEMSVLCAIPLDCQMTLYSSFPLPVATDFAIWKF